MKKLIIKIALFTVLLTAISPDSCVFAQNGAHLHLPLNIVHKKIFPQEAEGRRGVEFKYSWRWALLMAGRRCMTLNN